MSCVRRPLAGVVCLVLFATACPQPPNPVAMPADELGDTTVGASYSHTITATGGTGALSYAATGLPAGLSIDAGSGAITGTPAAEGDFTVEVTAADEKGQSASERYSLKVFPAVSFQTASLPDGTAGAPYSATLRAQGGKAPQVLSQTGGTLPAGLTFDAATGVLSGTPSAAGASGPLTFQSRESNGAVATATFSFTISPALALSATLPALANVTRPKTMARTSRHRARRDARARPRRRRPGTRA